MTTGYEMQRLTERANECLNKADLKELDDRSKNYTPEQQAIVVKHIENDILISEIAYRLGILDSLNVNLLEIAKFLNKEIQY